MPIMVKVPMGNLISVMQNYIFISSSALPGPSKRANLPAPPRKLPPSFAVQSSLFQDASESVKRIKKEDKAAERTAEYFNLFRDYGFEDSQIEKLRKCRHVADISAKILKPKLDCFVENGFTGELLHNLIASNPYILRGSLDSCIKPRFQFLKQYLDSDEKVVTTINRSTWIFTTGYFKPNLVPNIEFLINEGVPVSRVSLFLLTQPRSLLQSRDRMVNAVKTVRESGVAPDDPMFIHVLHVVLGLSESCLKKKFELFKSLGWSDGQALNILKTYPNCLGLTEEKIRSKVGFLIDTIKLEPEIVIRHPSLLPYKEERIRARYEVLKILKSKKLIRGVKISTAVTFSEGQFLERFVIKHVKSVPGLLEMYIAIAPKGKNRQGRKTET